ncbi:MAG: hypothetical protein KGJ23_08650 [Euryarchaeota archaeon]|nr:hypothetical protein [Euryarchaeota archaeon]MDE1836672.1 hypothetical protein [Euryarchaeota archaeon]MDE1880299.1 hypothetical protein [Euryarchaeota archaeon]MDE2044642.1 hypothetical protein [Thermoplasmata archaeon]
MSDNSGDPIDAFILEKYPLEAAEKYGGVSVIPKILGCFKGMERDGAPSLQCEEVFRFEVTLEEHTPDETQENSDFFTSLAHRAALELGQESVFNVTELDVSEQFVAGERLPRLPQEKLSRDVFRRTLGR